MPSRQNHPDYHRARIQKALEFIDRKLSTKLTVIDIANAAHFSEYHFHRLFPAYTGESIHGYVRTRRLEKAVLLMHDNPNMRLLDIALSVGFETHSAFARAFKQHFGTSPSQFDATTRAVHSAPMSLSPFLTEPLSLEWSIQSQPQMTLIYKIAYGTASGQFFPDQRPDRDFLTLLKGADQGLLGLVSAFPASPKSLNDETTPVFYGGLFTRSGLSDWSEESLIFPAGPWAVFEHKGSYDFLHQSWNRIYRAWLPHTDRRLRNTLPFEMYLNSPHQTAINELVTQIWLPIE